MRLPTFILGGAQKSGTTMLHHYLRAHPDIFIPRRPQELHFFDLDRNYARGVEWYARHFAPATAAHRAVGQTSPMYLYAPDAAKRIAGLLPDVKLIFILRNPVDRTYSHYWHEIKKGRETLDFEAALAAEARRLAAGDAARRAFSYVDRGRYAAQLQRYFDVFPREHILVLRTEDLGRDPERTLDACARFLGVEPRGAAIVRAAPARDLNASRIPRSMRAQRLFAPWRSKAGLLTNVVDWLNLKRAPYPPMTDGARRRLQVAFADDIAQVERLTGVSLQAWRAPATRPAP
jgi:hypothetical protein